MRGFIVLCLSAVALAAPQGYNYAPSGGGAGISSGFSGSAFPAGFSSGPAVSGSFGGGPGGFFQSGGGGGYVSSHGGHGGGSGSHHQEAVVTKRFFIHSAPEEHDEDHKERHITVGVPKKNYNVVFIKAPSKSAKKTTLKITPAVNEEKTVVYVLTKKADAHDVHTEVLEQPTATSKPEVFFIKYNTNEEAAHAQEQIQSQYDALGGSSQVTDEGFAPVSSVIGSLGHAAGPAGGSHSAGGPGYAAAGGPGFGGAAHGSGSLVSGGGGRGSANAYLPPNLH